MANIHKTGICIWELPTIVAECAEARALFHDDAALRSFFADTHGHGSAGNSSWSAWLDLISQVLNDHLRHEHGPVQYHG
ncbi:hypothetical protein [Streptodolium elevatio]|uniref:Uncharacterized protein n=1 Tax=Streptodolium elevatio TaxID=3157996 RepID=A0ABV3DDK8_9ACTN